MKIITHILDAHPCTGSPNINFLMTINTIAAKEIPVQPIPIQDAMLNGTCEKLTIPFIEDRKSVV